MKDEGRNIYSVFDEILSLEDKVKLLKQNPYAIWMTGLSGSGKTTIAKHLERRLYDDGILTQILDGDNIRAGINNNLGFSEEDRKENIRRIAEVTKLFVNCGVVTLNCFVSPSIEMRQHARDIIGPNRFLEVFVDTPLEICEKRDVKGLYKKARAGEIKDFTGISAPFESPTSPNIVLKTENKSVEESTEELYQLVIDKIRV